MHRLFEEKIWMEILCVVDYFSLQLVHPLTHLFMQMHKLKIYWVKIGSDKLHTQTHTHIQCPWLRLFDKQLDEVQIQFSVWAQL